MSKVEARHFIVEGRVQGVGFRYFVRRTAKSLGVAGWVRNLPDGTVEAHAEGDWTQIGDLRERLRSGPPSSHVLRLHEQEASVTGMSDFEIRF